VLGNPSEAKESKLTTFVAGDTTAIKSCKQLLLDAMGQVYALAEKRNIDLQLVNEILEMIFAYPGLKQYTKRVRTRF
jgi:hypothetical protein